jgi:hypothetical protein
MDILAQNNFSHPGPLSKILLMLLGGSGKSLIPSATSPMLG